MLDFEIDPLVHAGMADKTILITGACGTVAGELLRQIATLSPKRIIGIDHDEAGLFFRQMEYRDDPRFAFHLANVRDLDSLTSRFEGVDIVLHTAALKHVPLCEDAPLEAIQTNIVGTQNVLVAARKAGVERVLFTSTDKAVNPTNVMGTSKLMAERLVTASNTDNAPISLTTRFGNVLGSSGSVVPVFRRQIAEGGPVTVTDASMSRFIMTLTQASTLVLESTFLGNAGDVLITKMPVVNINDLAHVMIEALAPLHGRKPDDIEVTNMGTRPGEKLYEELMNEEEVRRSWDIGDFLLVQPALSESGRPETAVDRPDRPYNSDVETALTRLELHDFLDESQLLFGPEGDTQ